MIYKNHIIYRHFSLTWLGFIIYAYSIICSALPLTFTIFNPDRTSNVNSTEIFSGMITNNTGTDILASDLSMNFSGFDSSIVSLTQLLGVPDFTIINGGTSPTIDLFNFSLSSNAVPPTYSADVFIQQGYLFPNISNIETVSVSVVPEPTMSTLISIDLIIFLLYTGHLRPKSIHMST